MKIAVVIENYRPIGGGGNERSTEQIVERLASRNHQVTVLTNRASHNAGASRVKVIRAKGPKTNSALGLWWFAQWARKQLKAGGFDVSLSVTLAVAADVVQPRGGTVRETLNQNIAMRRSPLSRLAKQAAIALSPKQLALLAAERRTLTSGRVKKIVTISGYVADQLFRHYTVPSRRLAMIPNAATITPMDQSQRAAARRKARQALALADDETAMLFAAVNPRLKGLDRLLEALVQLRRSPRADKARLIVAGSQGYAYQQRAVDLGVRDMLCWIGPTCEIDSLYAAADLLVHPTYYDPSSKVVIEALLHGKPAISTMFNGASQWIADATGSTPLTGALEAAGPHRAGRVIASPDDVDALAQAMIDLCDPAERARCAAATEHLDPALHMDHHTASLEALLTEVAEG